MPIASERLYQGLPVSNSRRGARTRGTPAPANPHTTTAAVQVLKAIRAYREAHEAQIVRELMAFVAVPNEVGDAEQVRANARALTAMMERRGIRTEWLTPASGRPAVFGELAAPGATTTLLVYGHYDGVAAEREEWHSEPYRPVLRASHPVDADWATIPLPEQGPVEGSWRLYGRSVADSKNAIVGLLSALDALNAAGEAPRVNLKFLFDGEEEQESPGLLALVEAHREKLRADLLVSASGEVNQSGLPTAAFGVRGALTFDATVHTATEELHSGHFGNFAPNAAFRMAELLAGLKGTDGRVRVEGFYDDVVELTASERSAVRAIPRVERGLQARFAIAAPERAGLLQELINEPTLNVRGLAAGSTGAEARNIIPREARADFDVRLVKGMDPERTFQRIAAHLRREGWTVLSQEPTSEELRTHSRVVVLRMHAGFPAARTRMDLPVAQAFLGSVRRATGEALIVEPTEGGSLQLHLFERLGTPVVTLPISNYDCNQHTADENLELRYLFRGIDVYASLFLWN